MEGILHVAWSRHDTPTHNKFQKVHKK